MTDGELAPLRPAELSRRRVLALAVLAPVAVAAAGCSGPDPAAARAAELLRELAHAARADAALAAAAIAAHPDLTERIDPLRAARLEHAAALDAELARMQPQTQSGNEAPNGPPANGAVTRSGPPAGLPEVREAITSAAATAAEAALTVPIAQVGLVASIAACCAAYAAELE